MIYTNEEAAMIDGMIGTLFGGANVAENVRDAYQTVRRHLTEDSLDQKDLSRISAAIDFSLKNQFWWFRTVQIGVMLRKTHYKPFKIALIWEWIWLKLI